MAELLHAQKEDLMDLLKRSIKRGGTRECVLAANGRHFAALVIDGSTFVVYGGMER